MRVIKVVEAVVQRSSWRIPWRHVFRVIECDEGQSGCPFEPGITKLWQSDSFTYDKRSHGPRSKRTKLLVEAVAFAQHARRALEVGLRADTPAWAVRDLREELGLDPTGPVQGRGDDRPVFIYFPEPADADRRPA
jgi:hypothetical protein